MRRRSPARSLVFALWSAAALVFALGGAACRPKGGESTSEQTPPGDGRHPLTGTIVTVNKERGTLLVAHDEIPGFMAAMTMEFKVSKGDLENAREGERIRGVLYQSSDGFHLEQIWPIDDAGERIIRESARGLRQDTVTRGRSAYREVGENLPDFALFDQSGEVVQASRFRGRQIALNFIFTRCPDATMCPAATLKMTQLQQMAREAGVENFQLVSITLDPEYDTPGVLRDYAEQRGIDTGNFSFLTGPESAIKDLMSQLGVLAFNDGPLIRHTLATVLIDEKGKIVHRVVGSQWEAEEFASRLHRTSAGQSS